MAQSYKKKGWKQPKEEKEAERKLIKDFVEKIKSCGKECEIVKLQGEVDDGKTDGIIKYSGREICVEARRKGFPNHEGKAYDFVGGWKCRVLASGIYLNERTIKEYKNRSFIFLVEIKGCKPRFCFITKERVEELLSQPFERAPSTNSGVLQPVKKIPLDWFKEY